MKKISKYNSEQGNAIVWILIAVGLFAALGFTMAQGSRSSTSSITNSQISSYAHEIIAYGNEIKSAVKRLRLRGCKDTQISFENSIVAGYTNPNAPSNKTCHIFETAGGGLIWATPKKELETEVIDLGWTQWWPRGLDQVQGLGTDCANASCNELTISLWGIKKDVCLAINDALNVTNIGLNPPIDSMQGAPKFQGVYTYNAASVIGDTTPELASKPTACFKDVACIGALPECYVYYQSLLSR